MAKETFIQVGVTALRSPMGDFLPSVPLYIKTTEAAKASGLTQSEENLVHNLSGIFAIKHLEMEETGGKLCRNTKR